MIATLLFVVFIALMLAGVPIAVALGIGGIAAIAAANADAPWWGLFAAPQNMHASIAKYPLLALPMFVLVGSIFDRSGVARRMVTFAEAMRRPRARHVADGRDPGRDGARRHLRLGPGECGGGRRRDDRGDGERRLPGRVLGQRGRRRGGDRHPDSAVGRLHRLPVLVPGASVPALFAAGMVPGILAGLALIVPAVLISRRHGMGESERSLPRPPFWAACATRTWGLAAPVLILGGMRAGWFTPTEAAVVAVFYGLFVGHGDPPHDQGARPVRDPARVGRDVGGDHAGGVARRHLRVLAVNTLGVDRPGGRARS